MVPQTQNGKKELPSRVEAIRLCNCAHATLSQQWGAAFDSLTHERVCDDTVRRSVDGCVSKYFWAISEIVSHLLGIAPSG